MRPVFFTSSLQEYGLCVISLKIIYTFFNEARCVYVGKERGKHSTFPFFLGLYPIVPKVLDVMNRRKALILKGFWDKIIKRETGFELLRDSKNLDFTGFFRALFLFVPNLYPILPFKRACDF